VQRLRSLETIENLVLQIYEKPTDRANLRLQRDRATVLEYGRFSYSPDFVRYRTILSDGFFQQRMIRTSAPTFGT
jgi:hypothetical protein